MAFFFSFPFFFFFFLVLNLSYKVKNITFKRGNGRVLCFMSFTVLQTVFFPIYFSPLPHFQMCVKITYLNNNYYFLDQRGFLSRTNLFWVIQMSCPMGKPTICICKNKDADQLRGNREADQRLCFRNSDSTIPLLLKSEISSF